MGGRDPYVRIDRGDRHRYGGPRRNQTPHGDRETSDPLASRKSLVEEGGGEREGQFRATDTQWAPWHVIRSDDKKRAQLNTISHLLTQIPWLPRETPTLPNSQKPGG